MFRVTRSYLNLLGKPRIFSDFLEKYNLCILKGEMPFKMHKFLFFFSRKNIKKYMRPTLPKIFRPVA